MYGTYYVSYQTLEGIDEVTQSFGPAKPFVDLALLPYTAPLVGLEVTGLVGDIIIDKAKDAMGTGQG